MQIELLAFCARARVVISAVLTVDNPLTDMTPHYFCRTFRQSIGMPPHRDLISRRIERSKELLASTDKDVTEIALEVGFSSHAHFSAAFQRAVGYAPRTYRNSVRHGALR